MSLYEKIFPEQERKPEPTAIIVHPTRVPENVKYVRISRDAYSRQEFLPSRRDSSGWTRVVFRRYSAGSRGIGVSLDLEL